MRTSRSVFQQAWNSNGRGSLFSPRSPNCGPYYHRSIAPPSRPSSSRSAISLAPPPPPPLPKLASTQLLPLLAAPPQLLALRAPRLSASSQRLSFSTSRVPGQEAQTNQSAKPTRIKDEDEVEVQQQEDEESRVFGRSEKADQAAQLDLSARLSKDGASGKSAGWREVWRLIKIARPEVKTLSLAVGFLVISSSISMSIPASIGKILDIATKKEGSADLLFGFDLTTFYIALGSVLTLGAAANFGRIVLLRIVGERVVARLRSRLFRNTYIQNAEFFDANRVGDLISRLGSDTVIVGKSITQNLSDGLRSLISGAAGFSLMAYMSLKLTGVLLVMLPPVALGAFLYGRAIRNLSRKIQNNLGTLTKIAEERLGNVKTSQAFTGEIQEVHRYNRQVKQIFDLGKREALINSVFFSSSGWAGNMTILALLYVGGGMVQSGAISIGELTSFLMYTAYAGSSMFGLSGFYSELMKGVGAASRLFELQDRQPTISPTRGDKVKSLRGPIEFNHVAFSYPTRPKVAIFNNLSFKIEQGSNVAIVAPSGAGKSTVASLLLRFYTPGSGTITINGKDIGTMNVKQLRKKIGYVGQEPVLFSGSIAENIAYGKPDASRGEIVSAARRANCTFISDFPDGLETDVGPRGAQLSGGQKQRIAIARALLKDPDILILDEATSALDAESETLVNAALGSLLRSNNTTISIAHRLSTIVRSDIIICIGSDGQVAETGTYKELTANPDGAFSKMMERQMSGGDDVMDPRKQTPFKSGGEEDYDSSGDAVEEEVVSEEERISRSSLEAEQKRDH